MPRRSKLDWMKTLRTSGNLSGAEFRVLVILATYSDKDLLNAHPGVKRLMKETGMARSTIIKALATLQDRGWIRLTEEGGNQYGKGLANTYSIHTPAVVAKGPIDTTDIHKGTDDRTLKGPTSLTLVAPEGSDPRAKGPIDEHQGSDPEAVKGLVDRTPSGPTSGPTSGPSIHHSAGEPSGHRPAHSPPVADPWQYDDHGLSSASYDHLIEILGGLDPTEENAVDGMLANGAHPQAVINTITQRRTPA